MPVVATVVTEDPLEQAERLVLEYLRRERAQVPSSMQRVIESTKVGEVEVLVATLFGPGGRCQ